ncbi:MAG: hypothetical protein H6686_09355 [Fibrobacteria bacterium]|nr:hypothetical protein [Fibrobacteria bacterium]
MTNTVLGSFLHQGRTLDGWSRTLALMAALPLALSFATQTSPVLPTGLFLTACIVAGLAQSWFAFRSGFDAEIFAKIGDGPGTPQEWTRFDASLNELGLRTKPIAATRDEASRRRGALRLLVWQTLLVLAQAVFLLSAFFSA